MLDKINTIRRIHSPISLAKHHQHLTNNQQQLLLPIHHSGDLEFHDFLHVIALRYAMDKNDPENNVPVFTNERREKLIDKQSIPSQQLTNVKSKIDSLNEQQTSVSETTSPDIGIKRTSGSFSLSNDLLDRDNASTNAAGLRSEGVSIGNTIKSEGAVSHSSLRFDESLNAYDRRIHYMDSSHRLSWFLSNVTQTYPDEVLVSLCERIWLALQ